jgi:ribosomal protein S18 acetylase RimI-like enzyme
LNDEAAVVDASGVKLVRLDGAALDAVERLHHRSIAGMDRGLVKPERRSFFEGVFAGRGEIVGAVVDGSDAETGVGAGRLIGYGVLLTVLADGEDAGVRIGLGGNDGLAKIAGTGVDPGFRGRGLQKALVRRRIERAGNLGFRHVFATAAPGNTVSWRNLMAEGFAIVDVVLAYGSLERYLLHRLVDRAARAAAPSVDGSPLWCRADRTDGVRAALSAGLVGPLWRTHGPEGLDIGFVPSAEVRP